MKMMKSGIVVIGLVMLLVLSMTVSAETETDGQGDVWHWVYPKWQETPVSNQPNCDIKEIKAEINGDQITLSMTLWPGGTFSRGQYGYTSYIMFYNTSDAYYMMGYSDIIGTPPMPSAMGVSLSGYNPPMTYAEPNVNGNTLSVTMDKVGEDTSATEFHGVSSIWESYGAEQLTNDRWFDWVGDYSWDPELDPENNVDGDDTTNGDTTGETNEGTTTTNDGSPEPSTPGFETLAILAALGVAYIILRKRN